MQRFGVTHQCMPMQCFPPGKYIASCKGSSARLWNARPREHHCDSEQTLVELAHTPASPEQKEWKKCCRKSCWGKFLPYKGTFFLCKLFGSLNHEGCPSKIPPSPPPFTADRFVNHTKIWLFSLSCCVLASQDIWWHWLLSAMWDTISGWQA